MPLSINVHHITSSHLSNYQQNTHTTVIEFTFNITHILAFLKNINLINEFYSSMNEVKKIKVLEK